MRNIRSMCRDIERWEVNEVQIPGKKIEPQWPFLDTLTQMLPCFCRKWQQKKVWMSQQSSTTGSGKILPSWRLPYSDRRLSYNPYLIEIVRHEGVYADRRSMRRLFPVLV
jgi:hypothetical protein